VRVTLRLVVEVVAAAQQKIERFVGLPDDVRRQLPVRGGGAIPAGQGDGVGGAVRAGVPRQQQTQAEEAKAKSERCS
jgi:hypothetical protein